mgnify:CR=1 FL=1
MSWGPSSTPSTTATRTRSFSRGFAKAAVAGPAVAAKVTMCSKPGAPSVAQRCTKTFGLSWTGSKNLVKTHGRASRTSYGTPCDRKETTNAATASNGFIHSNISN